MVCRATPPRATQAPPRAGLPGPADVAAYVGSNRSALQDIVGVPLTTEALASLPALMRPGSPTMITLAIECALTSEQSVSLTIGGATTTVRGRYRMAPEWANGPCDEACQEWVTGCMLARINAYGVPVRIYVHTNPEHPDRQGAGMPQQFGYLTQEGAFYGNFFASPPRIYACRGRGRDPLYDTFRVCTHPGSACKIQAVGPCLPSTDAAPDEAHACDEVDASGAMRRCHNRLSLPGGAGYPEGARAYDRLVTVYLPRSAMSEGLTAQACSEGTSPDTHLPRERRTDPGQIGDACQNDDDCNGADLVCDHLVGPGICTRGCVATGDAAQEAMACRDEAATCARGYDNWDRCARACRAVRVGGTGCAAGQVCTGYRLFTEFLREATGCVPFCASDADCGGSFCNPRTGECNVAPPREDLLPDGEPCESGTRVCRGWCVPVRGRLGLCGSYINRGVTARCPEPGFTPTLAAEDDLALCVTRSCTDTAVCPAGLECISGRCLYP